MPRSISDKQKSRFLDVIVFEYENFNDSVSFFEDETGTKAKGAKKARNITRYLVEPLFFNAEVETSEPVISEACQQISKNITTDSNYKLSQWSFKCILFWFSNCVELLSEGTISDIKDMLLLVFENHSKLLNKKSEEPVISAVKVFLENLSKEDHDAFCASVKSIFKDSSDKNELIEEIIFLCENSKNDFSLEEFEQISTED